MPNHVSSVLRVTGDEAQLQAFRSACQGFGVAYAQSSIEAELGIAPEPRVETCLTFHGIVPVPADVQAQTFDPAGYDWQRANWGTKWDAYGHPQVFQAGNGALIYTFETAWSAPLPWLRAAVKRFSKLTFELWSRDEYPWCMSVLACHDEDAPNGIRWEECYGEMRVTKDGA